MLSIDEFIERSIASSKVRACDTDIEAEVERQYQDTVSIDKSQVSFWQK